MGSHGLYGNNPQVQKQGWFNLGSGRDEMGKEQVGNKRIRCGKGKRDIGFDLENLPKVVGPDYGQKILNFTDILA